MSVDCAVCAFADKHGWWGPDHRGTHCRTCHRSWSGKAEAHCVTCCAHFSRDSVAQKHRAARGGCIPPADVLRTDGEPAFRSVERASGPVWIGSQERELPWADAS